MPYLQIPLTDVRPGDSLKFTPTYSCHKCKKSLTWAPKNEPCPHCNQFQRYDNWKSGRPRFYIILAIEGNLAQVAPQEWILMLSPQITFGRKVNDESQETK